MFRRHGDTILKVKGNKLMRRFDFYTLQSLRVDIFAPIEPVKLTWFALRSYTYV